jgi:hypothetical protein
MALHAEVAPWRDAVGHLARATAVDFSQATALSGLKMYCMYI